MRSQWMLFILYMLPDPIYIFNQINFMGVQIVKQNKKGRGKKKNVIVRKKNQEKTKNH